MRRLLIALAAAAVLSGCATAPAVHVQRVEVPVTVPCVKNRPARPDFDVEKLTGAEPDGAKVLALALDTPKHLKYESQLVAVIEGCQ